MKFSFLLIHIILILLMCTNDDSISNMGGCTESVGMIYYENGQVADSATILFIPSAYNPQKDSNDSYIDTAYSDSNGIFNYSAVNDGKYNILYVKDSLKALRENAFIENGKCEYEIIDTLHLTGSVKGVVKLLENHDCRNVFILILGSNIYTTPYDSLGNFEFKDLAAGTCKLRIITTYDNYEVVDTVVIAESGKDVIISDTIKLPYTGLYTLKGVAVQYDTLLMEAMISWNRDTSTNIAGYRVFRKIIGISDQFELIDEKVITDNCYLDDLSDMSIFQDGLLCMYKIAAVDNDGNTGKLSDSVIVKFDSFFNTTKSKFITTFSEYPYGGMAVGNDGFIYVVSSDSSRFYKVDIINDTVIIINLPDEIIPYDIHLMSDSTFLVACDYGVYNIDKDGNRLYRYKLQTTDITSKDSRYIYYVAGSDFFVPDNSIRVFDSYTGIDTLFYEFQERSISSMEIYNDKIYIASTHFDDLKFESSDISIYSENVVYSEKNNNSVSDIIIGENDMSILCKNEIINFNNKSFKKESKVRMSSDILFIRKQLDGSILAMDKNGFLCCIQKIDKN